MSENPDLITPELFEPIKNILREAPAMDLDSISVTIVGQLKDGQKLVKADWNGNTHLLSDRTMNALAKLGITINDNPDNYVF